MGAHEADDGGDDPFSGLEPAVAEAARNTIYDTRMLCNAKGLVFGYNPAVLKVILRRAYQFADIQQDSLLRAIKVASAGAAGIIMLRPFDHLSRPAGMIFLEAYLNKSGFEMNLGGFKKMDREVSRMLVERELEESQLQHLIELYLVRYARRIG